MPQVGNRMLNPLFFSNLVLWWIAERVQGAGNDAIDLSIGGHTGTNANVTIQPAIVNGRPVFRFNGVNAELTYPQFASTQNFSAFAVVKNTTNVTARSMQCWANRLFNNQCLAGNAANQLGCFDNVNNPVSGVVDDYTNFSLIGVICTAGSCEFFQNNVSQGVGAVGLASLNLTTFGEVLTVAWSTMDAPEMVFYAGTALNATQRTVLNEYFRERYAY